MSATDRALRTAADVEHHPWATGNQSCPVIEDGCPKWPGCVAGCWITQGHRVGDMAERDTASWRARLDARDRMCVAHKRAAAASTAPLTAQEDES